MQRSNADNKQQIKYKYLQYDITAMLNDIKASDDKCHFDENSTIYY